jgi:RNA polymerase sigma-70 factor (ECF subfamily)
VATGMASCREEGSPSGRSPAPRSPRPVEVVLARASSALGVGFERTDPEQVGDVARQDLGEADDRELVAQITRHDEAALAEAVRRHRGSVVAFARRLVGDHERAEDIAQEVFLRLWERSDRFDTERGSLRTFLLAVTHGRALDVVRSDAARRAREERDATRTSTSAQTVDGLVVAQTVAGATRVALAQLPDAERRAVELAYLGGHSYRVVAKLLDEPEGTVKSRIRSGLARLRTALAAQDLQDP